MTNNRADKKEKGRVFVKDFGFTMGRQQVIVKDKRVHIQQEMWGKTNDVIIFKDEVEGLIKSLLEAKRA